MDINSGTTVQYSTDKITQPHPSPQKSTFGIHGPCGIKILFQLRVGLSPLKGHKKNHYFLDTPSAICDCGGGKEDIIHFFTECALFATTRTNLMRSISNILIHNNLERLSHTELTQLYLYGHCNLCKTLNCFVLQASIKYIHDTKRFTRSELTLLNCELPSPPLLSSPLIQPHAHTHHLLLFVLSFIIPTGYGTRLWHPSGFRVVRCFYLSMFGPVLCL